MRGTETERFWKQIRKGPRCWEWQGLRERGYGRMYAWGSLVRTHRVSWILHYGPIPEGQCVLHRCDNPACVRPDHLFLGTQLENIADRHRKGRSRGGSGYTARPRARRLSVEQVVRIRACAAENVSDEVIARAEGVAPSTVYKIKHRQTWKDV